MKKMLFVAMMLLFTFIANAQADVTKFLGIPIDGSKAEMIAKLKEKGFRMSDYNSNNDILEGEFNGFDVNVYIVTNKNKVCRIMICDKNTQSGNNIKNRFNILCEQFKNNPNYISSGEDYKIPIDENVEKEILINKKKYEAIFYQIIDTKSDWFKSELEKYVSSIYTPDQLAKLSDDERRNLALKVMSHFLCKKPVWFTISEFGSEYYITMYYDNEYNRANGEDL